MTKKNQRPDPNPWDDGTFSRIDFGKELAEVGNADDGDIGRERVEW